MIKDFRNVKEMIKGLSNMINLCGLNEIENKL
jgi:hypothetical protein